MRILLTLAVIAMTLSSIAVRSAQSDPVEMNQLAATLAAVHAINVVDDATNRRLKGAD